MDHGADETDDPLAPLNGAVARLVASGLQRRYRKGMHLINEGEHGDTLFVILSGRVRAYSVDLRDRSGTCADGSSQTPVGNGASRRKSCHR